jgi:hypothetical protein
VDDRPAEIKITQTPAATLLIGVGLFILALLVRLPYLGDFMTVDEERWVKGGGQFLLALANGPLTDSYWHFHPGITIVWGEAILLWLKFLAGNHLDITTFVNEQMADLAATIGYVRLSPAIITALTVAGIYWLARPLLGEGAALLGAGLLAVDPFFVAHSRIVNGDAAAAGLMMLTFLAFARLWQKPALADAPTLPTLSVGVSASRRHASVQAARTTKIAALAGVMAGLALLTKLPSPLILPWIGVMAGLGFVWNRNWQFWAKALLFFGLAVGVTFIGLWPAMWVAPVETVKLMYHDAFEMGEIGSGHDTFFWGEISRDPGWLFYPYALAFRLTPLTSLGLIGAIFFLGSGWREIKRGSLKVRVAGTLLLYVIFVVVLASFSPKKLDRYVMAVIPPLILVAGLGLEWLVNQLKPRWSWLASKQGADAPNLPTLSVGVFASRRHASVQAACTTQVIVPLGIILGQLFFVISNYPYVLTFYNPLLGGFARASEQVPTGWGEGIEQAVHWLNQQPDAPNLNISIWYSNIAEYYMVGKFIGFSETGGTQLEADYTVFYLNQTTRQLPFPALVRYFQHKEPVYTVEKAGVPYVWVYKAPGLEAVGKPEIVGRAQLYGYTLNPDKLRAGTETQVTLYFLTKGALPENETFAVSLEAEDGQSWGLWQNAPTHRWLVDEFVEWQGTLQLPADIPPGNYFLEVKLIDTNINSEVTRFELEELLAVEQQEVKP